MNHEQLQPQEQLRPQEQIESPVESQLNADAVNTLYEARKLDLETLKQWVGLKFYYRASEKIKQEEQILKQLLRIESAKQSILADYSFVLDQAYFEQKFLS